MGSTSFQFLGFAFAVVLAYHVHRSAAWRQTVLLAANLLFLASFSRGPWSFVPFAAFVILGYATLLWIRRFPRFAFRLILVATIAIFVWLKKYTFVPGSLFLQFPYVAVGLSYVLFRMLHLMVDTHSGDVRERIPVVSYFNYALSFTTLVSGPIQLYQDYSEMQAAAAAFRLNAAVALAAIERIIAGLFKVNILALLASTWHTRALEALGAPLPMSWIIFHGATAIVSYPIFLYCNFSGYIDVVIGIGRLLGFILPENFVRPFSSDNFIDFWSRWHITLSSWLKTYVYNQLLRSLMRRFPTSSLQTTWLVLALFVTFFLIGIWHGGTSEFIFFGFLQGFGVAANQMYQIAMTRRMGRKRFKALSSNRYYVAISRGFTFTWFTFTLLWFWSSWAQIRALGGALRGVAGPAVWIVLFACSTLLLSAWEAARARILAIQFDGIPMVHSPYWRTAQSVALVVIVLGVTLLMNQSAPEIVYKAF
jgi:alginate O-acetyltransferase complex protein AlgI